VGIKRINAIYEKLFERLPKTYIKPSLKIHTSLKKLQKDYKKQVGEFIDKGDPGYLPYAFCSCDITIHLPRCIVNKGDEFMLGYILHELGHLYALNKYGEDDERWANFKTSENYAERFSKSWMKRLKQQGWLKKL
jgi:hypothetical protein